MSASAFASVQPPREQPREQPPGQREQQRQEAGPRPARHRPGRQRQHLDAKNTPRSLSGCLRSGNSGNSGNGSPHECVSVRKRSTPSGTAAGTTARAAGTAAPGGRPSTSPAGSASASTCPRPTCRPRGAAAARLTHPAHHPARSAPPRPAAGAGRRSAQPPRPETRKPARGRLRWRQGAAAPGLRTAAPPGPCSTSPSYRQGSAGCASGGPPHGQGARHLAAPQPRQPRSSPCR